MRKEHRMEERYNEIGKVDALDLCVLPGVLDDISITGCKVRFPVPVLPNMENEYKLKILVANNSLEMLCNPQWTRNGESGTEIGFKFLRSKDSPLLSNFIHSLQYEDKIASFKYSSSVAHFIHF